MVTEMRGESGRTGCIWSRCVRDVSVVAGGEEV